MDLHHYMQCDRLLCYKYTSSWMKQTLDKIAEGTIMSVDLWTSIVSKQEIILRKDFRVKLSLTVRHAFNGHIIHIPSISNVINNFTVWA
jgi:hypothetical protein